MAHKRRANDRTAHDPHLQDTVRLSSDGVAKVMGDLEARVMSTVWSLGQPVPAREVHARVAKTHDVHPLTVTTVLNRLATKGWLRRVKRDDLLHYEARCNEAEFFAYASRHVVEGVVSLSPAVVASFVDVLAERDPEQLAELGRLVQRKLKERGRAP